MALLFPTSLAKRNTPEKVNSILERWSSSRLGLLLHRVLSNTEAKWVKSPPEERQVIEDRLGNAIDELEAQLPNEGNLRQINKTKKKQLIDGIQMIRKFIINLLSEQNATNTNQEQQTSEAAIDDATTRRIQVSEAVMHEDTVQASEVMEAANSDKRELLQDITDLAGNQEGYIDPLAETINLDPAGRQIQLFNMRRRKLLSWKYQCQCLKYEELRYHLMEEAYSLDSPKFYPDLWIQDHTRTYEGGRHRWKWAKAKERAHESTTLVGFVNNLEDKPSEYMVASVNEKERELPAAFDLPRPGIKSCCSSACPSFRAHLNRAHEERTWNLTPVVNGGWFKPESHTPPLDVPLNRDYFAPLSNEVYLLCQSDS